MKKTYHFDLQNLCQKNQTKEAEINTLLTEAESLRARNLVLESDSYFLATELKGLNEKIQLLESKLFSHQNEINNWKGKTQFLETVLSTQLELMTTREVRILTLDIGLTKAQKSLSELNAKHKELQAEHISKSNYILEQQSTIAKGVEEYGRLQKDLKKVQDTLASRWPMNKSSLKPMKNTKCK